MSVFESTENLWGCDLGNDTIHDVILKSAQEPEVLYSWQLPTESHSGYAHVLDRVNELVQQLGAEAGYPPTRLGLVTPGTLVARTGLLKNTNTECLESQPLAADLAVGELLAGFGCRPTARPGTTPSWLSTA